ncbi:MAG: nucleoside phosphorylase [Oscillospiraceae bacterium]|nr:nucleoside phosphorylase [Oscillospiraceae bacterium]
MSIIDTFDPAPTAVINPEDLYTQDHRKLDACIFNFSWKIMDALLEADLLELVDDTTLRCVSTKFPLYVFKGTNIGVIKNYVGAPMTAGLIEELCYAFSCRKIVLFGSCGGLDKSLDPGKLIVPTHAYRDEGMSYHYLPAADYIEIKNHEMVSTVMDRLDIPYVKGRSWTTDACLRETHRNMERRKAEGCIVVEMELSACQAVADFRGYELYAFLYTGDNLDHLKWEEGILSSIGLDERLTHFYIALEIAKTITEANVNE